MVWGLRPDSHLSMIVCVLQAVCHECLCSERDVIGFFVFKAVRIWAQRIQSDRGHHLSDSACEELLLHLYESGCLADSSRAFDVVGCTAQELGNLRRLREAGLVQVQQRPDSSRGIKSAGRGRGSGKAQLPQGQPGERFQLTVRAAELFGVPRSGSKCAWVSGQRVAVDTSTTDQRLPRLLTLPGRW